MTWQSKVNGKTNLNDLIFVSSSFIMKPYGIRSKFLQLDHKMFSIFSFQAVLLLVDLIFYGTLVESSCTLNRNIDIQY